MLNIIQRCIWPMSLFCGWKNDCEAPLLGVAYRAQIEILTVANDKFLSANLRVNSKNSSFVKLRYWGYGELFLPALIVSRFRLQVIHHFPDSLLTVLDPCGEYYCISPQPKSPTLGICWLGPVKDPMTSNFKMSLNPKGLPLGSD